MSLVVKLVFFCIMLAGSQIAAARALHILVIGEGAAANCNAVRFGPVPGVYQLGRDGVERPARDPLEWADCTGGSIWIPLGQALIGRGLADKVVFVPVAAAGARVADWAQGGTNAAALASALAVAKARHLTFDYALFQQGNSDRATTSVAYRNDLRKLLRTVSFSVDIKQWLVAQGAGCGSAGAPQILAIHKEVARGHQVNRFAGPTILDVDPAFVDANCNFTEAGQRSMAQRWLAAIEDARQTNARYQKESLLFLFK